MGYSQLPVPASLGQPHFPNGDFDEKPYHNVTISPFSLSATEVTNAQYEAFDPSHKSLRGKLGFSPDDDDAVVFVTWQNATLYCGWLAAQTGAAYRLPTEAEWEYAARGNGSTRDDFFWTGASVPADMQKNQVDTGIPSTPQNLSVASFPPNSFGLYDTIGNVEEWTADWWGFYSANPAVDPVGPPDGTFRVTRGGSHSTALYYLRSANRAGALPGDSSWYIGFRVAEGGRAAPGGAAALAIPRRTRAAEEGEPAAAISRGSAAAAPSAEGQRASAALHGQSLQLESELRPASIVEPMAPTVRVYVHIDGDGVSYLPYAAHNHEPTVVGCANGDTLAAWFSCYDEPGREVGIVSARLAAGASNWTSASVLLDTPDRCECCVAFYTDAAGTLYHASAVSAAGTYEDIATTLRASTDCGLTWSAPSIVLPEHGISHQVVVSIIRVADGSVLMPCDHWGVPPFDYLGDQSIIQHAAAGAPLLSASSWSAARDVNNTNAHHFTLAELRNGTLVGVGRGHDIDGTLAWSYSMDGGDTWTPRASAFPGIHSGQRMVMLRVGPLATAPLMCCSFANEPMLVPDAAGGTFPVLGLYCALSLDEGETWAQRRVITDDLTPQGHMQEGFDGRPFRMAYNASEPDGYLASSMAADGTTIELISSRNHYRFNVAWLSQPAPPPQAF